MNDIFPKLAQPALRALHEAGSELLEQVTNFTEAQIKQLHGTGPNALNQLRRALKAEGLSFASRKQNKD